jgi:hypothetical protein
MAVIDPETFGVSFSVKQCHAFGIDPAETLDWLLHEASFRSFRLMSYWDEHEPAPGKYTFDELDRQVQQITKAGGVMSLCLGARQPRWPENHWPEWAWELDKPQRSKALLAYIEKVVERYKSNKSVVSYQLENEALLKNFGRRAEVDRTRLREEFALVRRLDPKRPIIMTTSTSWGIPLRQPIPTIIGFSYYRILYGNGRYHHAFHFPLLDRARAGAIKLLHHRPSFIHELQLEPWGPTAIWKMPSEEQDKSMGPIHIAKNVQQAARTNLWPIDLWGGEWWYWRLTKQHDPSVWQAVSAALSDAAKRKSGDASATRR